MNYFSFSTENLPTYYHLLEGIQLSFYFTVCIYHLYFGELQIIYVRNTSVFFVGDKHFFHNSGTKSSAKERRTVMDADRIINTAD